ncbi:PAS domain S-box-containing protein [Pontibacter aydingkolensis]|uniref:histidine kinase n=1 Tax=Pontibacter aydingkolensis TaxID=1911536 RepID=A0ABS7CXX2_9BACT|nr:PAS domain S-box protein [Pontibacter aydingkolensis]MBW7468372.1 PAS domain S-box protein [Pontibacter aydingkolensis]
MKPERSLIDFEKIVMNSPDVFGTIDEDGFILYVSEACRNVLGYEREELEGRNFAEFLHSDDLASTHQAIQEALKSGTKASLENRYIHRQGHAVPMHWMGVWSEGDGFLYCVGRDVTEQKALQNRLEEREQRYKALFDNSPEIVFVENREGLVTETNLRFLKAFGKSEEQVIGSPVSCFLSPDTAALNTRYLEQALLGNPTRFDLELELEGEVRIYDTSKHPIIVRNEVVGAHTVVTDITPLVESYETIQRQAKRLNTILESITDAFCTIDRDWKYTYVNSEFEQLTHFKRENVLGKSLFALYPSEGNPEFFRNYRQAMETGNPVHFDAYSPEHGKWFDVKVFPSKEGLSVYFSDITDKVKAQQEVKRLSLVASTTTNGVVIMGMDRRIEWVNEGFTEMTGFHLEESVGKRPIELLGHAQTDISTLASVNEKMNSGQPAAFEVLNKTKTGKDLWLSIKENPIFGEDGSLVNIVSVQTDITNLKRYQQELEVLSLVASKTTHGVVITGADGLTEWVNEGFTRLTGYSPSEMAGNKPGALLQGPETDEETIVFMREMLLKAVPFNTNIINYKKTGEKVWFSMDITPVCGDSGQVVRFIAIQKDITERKKIQQELEKLSLVASKTNNSVLIADRGWRIEWVNEGFTKLTGYTLPEATGKTPSKLLHHHSKGNKAFEVLKEKLLKGESISFEELIQKKTGEEAWVSVDITAILDEKEEPSRFIEVHTDITLLKEKELDLSRLTMDLYRQNNDLQQFTYIVSHNLRAPVANALGLANMLTRIDKRADMFDKSLANLQESIVRLDTVMKDMNTILSIRDSKGNLETEQVSIKLVIQQVVSSLSTSLKDCGGVVTDNLAEELCVSANKAYLYSIFYNLLSNAIKYRSEERTLAVSIKCFSSSDKGMLLSFADNGLGFDLQKARESVFKLYKRFHTDKKGRGIGLYLVRTHLEAIGGHVEVTSQVGTGTKFLIYLPKV